MFRENDRIGAIFYIEDQTKEVYLAGYGIYSGEALPIEAKGIVAELAVELKMDSPCLMLDDGSKIYGCECWWSAESEMRDRVQSYRDKGYRIVETSIEEYRNFND